MIAAEVKGCMRESQVFVAAVAVVVVVVVMVKDNFEMGFAVWDCLLLAGKLTAVCT
jgi:hypothetical protein